MVTSAKTMRKIKETIERRYRALLVSIVGKDALTRAQINELRDRGISVPDKSSLLELAYYHNLLNSHGIVAPGSVEDMMFQQARTAKVPDEVRDAAVEHANEAMRSAIEKMSQDVTARLVGLVQDNNQNARFRQMVDGGQTAETRKIMRESTVGKLKQRLRDASGDLNRDWLRVATTHLSDVIGVSSAERIAVQNKDRSADEVYVYRISVLDQALCKWCRRFYVDDDGSPKLYRLSTLLANGSNYGKHTDSWQPVVGATHPNERCSQIIELKRGWKILPGGGQTYIGPKAWDEYLINKLVA